MNKKWTDEEMRLMDDLAGDALASCTDVERFSTYEACAKWCYNMAAAMIDERRNRILERLQENSDE
jgi:hypothetical protein